MNHYFLCSLQCCRRTLQRPWHRRRHLRISRAHLFCWSLPGSSSSPTRRARGLTAQRPDIRHLTSGGWRPMGRPCRTCRHSGKICPMAHSPCCRFHQQCTDRTCTALCTDAWPPMMLDPSSAVTYTLEPVSYNIRFEQIIGLHFQVFFQFL